MGQDFYMTERGGWMKLSWSLSCFFSIKHGANDSSSVTMEVFPFCSVLSLLLFLWRNLSCTASLVPQRRPEIPIKSMPTLPISGRYVKWNLFLSRIDSFSVSGQGTLVQAHFVVPHAVWAVPKEWEKSCRPKATAKITLVGGCNWYPRWSWWNKTLAPAKGSWAWLV